MKYNENLVLYATTSSNNNTQLMTLVLYETTQTFFDTSFISIRDTSEKPRGEV